MEQKKKIRITIIILAVLLVFSLAALGGTILYNGFASRSASTVAVPDNLITPNEEAGSGESQTSPAADSENQTAGESTDSAPASSTQPKSSASAKTDSLSSAQPIATAPAQSASANETRKAATIELYNKQPEDNTAFQVGNMFPGDVETKYYCVRVSYHDTVTVHYNAVVRPGYEKLAEVLKVRVNLLTTGETLYDGVISEMPESLTHKLSSENTATDELYYEITAYLDTSVGNEYQNKDLIADFNWWVVETGNLDHAPKTGDTSNILLWAALAAASGCAMILLFVFRKRREEEEHV